MDMQVQMSTAPHTDTDKTTNASKSQPKPLRFVTNYGAPQAKRRRIGAACMTCRRRKTACSGERPYCETCRQNKLDCAGYSSEAASAPGTTKRTESESSSQQQTLDPSLRESDQGKKATEANSRPQAGRNSSSSSGSIPQHPAAEKSPRRDPGAISTPPIPGAPGHDQLGGSLFSGSRNRVPYFRWLGPTAIMPGFKQMVVKVKRNDSDMARSSTNGEGVMVSPPLNGLAPEPQFPHAFGNTPSAAESDARIPSNLPFYDTSPMPPSGLITHLAQTFFTHLGCNYPFLQRERFLRDLEEKQVDAILVDAVCALAARFSTHTLLAQQRNSDDIKTAPADYGHVFAQRAKNALTDTFAVPTVAAAQAALLLAYNEFGESRDSGLWMYLGISIRIAQDLGIQKLEGMKYKGKNGLTPKQVKRQAMSGTYPIQAGTRLFRHPTELAHVGECREDVEEQKAVEQERFDTFWAIFLLDRVVSSGTGRRSTLRDKDIELSFPPMDEKLPKSEWPAPFPALIRIVHLYGRVADLLNVIKEPTDITSETPKRLAAMESQVTNFYQGLSAKLHFDAVNFQYYMKAGEGTNFVLLHFWFHMLIVLLHQPTILKTFEGRMLQLFPNSQQLSMSSAKTIADILSYSQLMDAKASLGNPFTSQPIYIAACAFLKETAEQTATSNAQSRATSPARALKDDALEDAASAMDTPISVVNKQSVSGDSASTPNSARTATSTSVHRRSLAKHTLLATAASQHYQLCYKALQSLENFWAGTKYILTILDQKFEGVDDPLLYTVEEGECAIEQPKPDPAFTTPGWRRTSSWGPYMGNPGIGRDFLQARAGSETGDLSKAIGWTLTGTMNSPSTNLAWHYAGEAGGRPNDQDLPLPGISAFDSSAPHNHSTAILQQQQEGHHNPNSHHHFDDMTTNNAALPAYALSGTAVSDASLLLGLNNPYNHTNTTTSPNLSMYNGAATNSQQGYAAPQADMGQYSAMQPFGDMMIEAHDVDMSMLSLDMMPWFDTPYGTGQDMMGMFDPNANGQAGGGHQHPGQNRG